MMTTTLEPPTVPDEHGRVHRMLPIAVNLLPEEVLTARSSRAARRVTILLLVAAVLATIGWDVMAARDTSAAQDELAAAQDTNSAVVREQRGFTDLVTTKAGIDALRTQLTALTAGGVAWNRLYPAIRSVAPRGIALTGLSGTANTATQVPALPATTTTSDQPTPSSSTSPAAAVPVDPSTGSIIITGTAPTKATISQFVVALTKVRGLLSPIVTSVTTKTDSTLLSFGIQVTVTKQGLANRYVAPVVK